MFESFVRFEISVDKLIPEEFPVEDLAFSLIAAKAELNITDQAAKLEKEKAYTLREVSESLKSRIFKLLYYGVLKRLAIGTRYLDQLFSTLDELQRESKRILNSKAQTREIRIIRKGRQRGILEHSLREVFFNG